MTHGALNGHNIAPGGDESAGEVVPQVVQLVCETGLGPGGAPAVVDEVVMPRLAALIEQPPVRFPGPRVLADVLGQDRDQFLEKREPDWSPYPWYY